MADDKNSADLSGAKRLSNLVVDEVSIVDLGANERPFAITKNVEGDAMALSKEEIKKAEAVKKAEADKKVEAELVAKAKAEADKKAEEVAKAKAEAAPPTDALGIPKEPVTIGKSIEAALPFLRDAVKESNPELAGQLDSIVTQLSKSDITKEEAAKVLGVDLAVVEKAKRMTGGRMAELAKIATSMATSAAQLTTFAKQFDKEDEEKADDVKKDAAPESEASGDAGTNDVLAAVSKSLEALVEMSAVMSKRVETLETTQPAARGQGPEAGVRVEKSQDQTDNDLFAPRFSN